MSFISYAQNYEDVMLMRALGEVRHGFYIDVGAQDPIRDSVTKAFYELGWHGVNIEPVTYWFERVKADRPRDINLQLAVSDRPGELHLFEVVDSGLSTTDPVFAQRHVADGHQIRELDVPCLTLDEIVQAHRTDEIHFLKIDCEGSEAAALRGLSLKQTRPWIILLEATEPNSQKPAYAEWEPILLDEAYHFVYEDGLNRFYVADEHVELIEAFSHPPNVFDNFVRASEATALDLLQITQEHLRLFQDAQRLASAEAEVQRLHAISEDLRNGNERRETALVEHRRMLDEAGEREARCAAQMQAEINQLKASAEHFNLENERREAALVEHRRMFDEAVARETQEALQRQEEIVHWKTMAERLHAENESREASLVEHRRMLDDAEERQTEYAARTQAEINQLKASADHLNLENERREAALVEHRRMFDEAIVRETKKAVQMQAEIDHWKTMADQLHAENERREAALVEHRRMLDDAGKRQTEYMARTQAEINQLNAVKEYLSLEKERQEKLLVSNAEIIRALEAEQEKLKRMNAVSMQQNFDLRTANEYLITKSDEAKYVAASLTDAIEVSLEERRQLGLEIAALQKQVEDRKSDLDKIFLSRSWRITRPLRRITTLRYRWRKGEKIAAGQIDDIESKYRLPIIDFVDADILDQNQAMDISSTRNLHGVKEVLTGKDIEALNGLRRRIRGRNVR